MAVGVAEHGREGELGAEPALPGAAAGWNSSGGVGGPPPSVDKGVLQAEPTAAKAMMRRRMLKSGWTNPRARP